VKSLRRGLNLENIVKIVGAALVLACSFMGREAAATLFNVELIDNDGPLILGQVDTVSDTFTITAWTENPLGTVWWSAADLPRTYLALDAAGASFDVPDGWDGTIGTDWAFINPETLGEAGWINGLFSSLTLIRDGWGGGVDGSGVIDTSFAENVWSNLPFGSNSAAPNGFNSVSVTAVPEPAAFVTLGVGLVLVGLMRRRSAG